MKQKFSKNLHIMNSLVSFCHSAGAVEYSISLKPEHGVTSFKILASVPDMNPEMLSELKAALGLRRMHEVEQDYWELGGDSDFDYELTLIGMMLDESDASYEDGVLTIRAVRND